MGENGNRIRVPARIGNWLLDQNLGSGYSGSIWRATNPYTGQVAAIKVQDVDHECPTNRYERNFYPSLQGGKGMPTLWAAGVQGEYDYLVIDLLGPSLDSLYRKNGRRMDLRSTLCIAMQVISRLEFMHSRGILHRDIQLGNCTLGLGKTESTIHMIDFGFSKRYIDPHTRKHIPDSKAKRDFIGNYWFSSVNVHCRGRVPSRRDDMEALALMLIHIMTDGGLPWTRNGVPKTDNAHDAIIRRKLRTKPEDLCRGLPPVFEDFLRYCRRLKFLEQPDYTFWWDQFAILASAMGYTEADGSVSDDFIWPPLPEPALRQRTRPRKNEDVDIYMILEEIANLRLENVKLANGPKRAAPRPEPVPEASETPSSTRRPRTSKTREGGDESECSEPAQRPQKHYDKGKTINEVGIIVLSDSSDEDGKPSRQVVRATKQATLRLLTRRTREASNNVALADLLGQFLDTYGLTGSRSRIVTRDAFDFLDAVVQQIESPSAFVVPKTVTTESTLAAGSCPSDRMASTETRLRQRTARAQKAETVKELRQRIQAASQTIDNLQLAKLLSDFCQAVRATSGRTLTKDGIIFLEELETLLRQP